MPYKDIVKQKEAQAKHYRDNKEKYDEANRLCKRKRSAWFQEFKKTKSCIKCGNSDFRVLEFHHKVRVHNGNNKDRYTVSYLLNHAGRKRVLEEIDKCDCLCANCHKIEHWDEDSQEYTNAGMV